MGGCRVTSRWPPFCVRSLIFRVKPEKPLAAPVGIGGRTSPAAGRGLSGRCAPAARVCHNKICQNSGGSIVNRTDKGYNIIERTKKARQEQGVTSTLSPDTEAETFHANGFTAARLQLLLYPVFCRLASARGTVYALQRCRYGTQYSHSCAVFLLFSRNGTRGSVIQISH